MNKSTLGGFQCPAMEGGEPPHGKGVRLCRPQDVVLERGDVWFAPLCEIAAHVYSQRDSGTDVRVEERPPQTSFVGTLKNGVYSADYGSSDQASFEVMPLASE